MRAGAGFSAAYRMQNIDYSQLKGVADEPHWQQFVQEIGGELVAPLISRKGVKNADFLFRNAKIVAELKILETEFLESEGMQGKLAELFERSAALTEDFETAATREELKKILKAPLQRVINKANRQIKETKQELGLTGWQGVLILVNDGFRGLPPGAVMSLCTSALAGKSYSSTKAFIYLTNHYIELPDNPNALLFWAPLYEDGTDLALVNFVDDLGRKWRKFVEEKAGPFDYNDEQGHVDITSATVVTGPYRNLRYIDDNHK